MRCLASARPLASSVPSFSAPLTRARSSSPVRQHLLVHELRIHAAHLERFLALRLDNRLELAIRCQTPISSRRSASTHRSISFNCWHGLSFKAALPLMNARCQPCLPSTSATSTTTTDSVVVSSRASSAAAQERVRRDRLERECRRRPNVRLAAPVVHDDVQAMSRAVS